MQGESSELSACPSFNSYSSDRLAAIAAEVTREFDGVGDRQRQLGDDYRGEEPEDNDDDFEFVSVRRVDDVAVIDGHIGPVFPIFNRNLFAEKSQQKIFNETCDPEEAEGHDVLSVRVPLKQLFGEERDQTSSTFSTSSEEEVEDGLDGVPPGTYCIWTPNSSNNSSAKASPSKCKKSSSTGTGPASASKRWRLSSFLRRCNSEGKESLVFLTPKKEAEIRAEKAELDHSKLEKKVPKKAVSKETMSSAHETFYVRNRAMKEGGKRRTYLPYRQDLFGFWTSVGALGKTFPPF